MAINIDMVNPIPARRPTNQIPFHVIPSGKLHHFNLTQIQLNPTIPIGFQQTSATTMPVIIHNSGAE